MSVTIKHHMSGLVGWICFDDDDIQHLGTSYARDIWYT